MNKDQFLKIVGQVFNRGIFFYLMIAAFFHFGTNYKVVIRSAQLQTLSRLAPSFDYYDKFMRDPNAPDRKSLEECAHYHKSVVDLVPSAAGEAWSVVAFCSYSLGKKAEAMKAVGAATEKAPVFFWNYYNLGIMFLNDGDYRKAAEAFSKAAQLDPKYTAVILMRSKVYSDIRRSIRGGAYAPEQGLAEGYVHAVNLFKLSMACEADPQVSFCQERQKLRVRLF